MSASPTIMVVDDEPSMLRYTSTLLQVDDYNVETASSGIEAIDRLKAGFSPDLILLDMAMPEMNGMQTIEACRKIKPSQKIVVLSCVSTTSTVVKAIKLGALDYILKPFYRDQLNSVVERSLNADCGQEPGGDVGAKFSSQHHAEIEELGDNFFFLAASPAMKKIREQIRLIAKVDVSVLMLGESGVGKEIVAKLIHKESNRSRRPLLKVNCAALPSELLESELFGYEAGAFTGAHKSKPGKFELADGGTLLLDEIGEMSPFLQPKLLHVLQDGHFSRLGSRTSTNVDVRLLAATNINVEQAIANKTFRQDLYYRLNAFTLKIPPLRERREEIPLLLRHFMDRLSEQYAHPPMAYSEALLKACLAYHWPGNLRELGNFVKRFLILQDTRMALGELEDRMRGNGAATDAGSRLPQLSPAFGLKSMVRELKDEAELRAIADALNTTQWNRKRAALQLNISYKALLYKIKQYQLEPPRRCRTGEATTSLR